MSDPVLVSKMYLRSSANDFDGSGNKTGESVTLCPVYGKDGSANRSWSQATPSGELKLFITNKDAFGVLKGGYYKVLLVPCGEDD